MQSPPSGSVPALLRDALLVFLVLAAIVIHARGMQAYHFEDAFITFRYAQSLADGQGFVFNPGERILGTSTPLLTLILAACARLGLPLPATAGTLYVVALHASGLLGAWFLRRRGFAQAGALFVLLSVWAAGEGLSYFGMETTLHLFLILAAILAADHRRPILTGVLLGLLCLNRYDGVLPSVAVGLYLWHARRRPPWTEAAIAFLFFGSWLVFARLYFGSIFPNTLGAKAGTSSPWTYLATTLEFQTSSLMSPVKEYFGALEPATIYLLSLLFFLPCLALGPLLIRRRPALAMLPGFALLLAVGYAVIGPPVRHQWYHLPGLFGLCAFAFAGWGFAVELGLGRLRDPAAARARTTISWLCVALLGVAAVDLPARADARCKSYTRKRSQDKVKAYAAFADRIRELDLTQTSVLTHEPGFLTFRTGQRAVDAAGLVSRGIHYHGPKGRYTGWHSLVERHRPDMAVLPVPEGRPDPFMLRHFLPLVGASPHFLLFLERGLYEERLPDLLRRRQGPRPDVGRRGRGPKDQERAVTRGWTFRGAFDDEAGQGLAWSREFLVDFDEVVLDFAASSAETRLQLLVDGLVVTELSGPTPGSEPKRRGLSVYPWRGRKARIRAVDADPEGTLHIDGIRPRTYDHARRIDDFESEELSDFWQHDDPALRISSREIARRFGVQATHGHGAGGSLGLEGPRELRSRPFTVEDDRWVMAVLDAGGPHTGIHLEVDGRRVLSWSGPAGTSHMPVTHILKWSLKPWKGRQAVLIVRDADPDPDLGIAVDAIYGLRLGGP